jgi:hypothetical protein
MVITRHSRGIWLLAVYFVAVTVVGEAWHLLPGNDHGGLLTEYRCLPPCEGQGGSEADRSCWLPSSHLPPRSLALGADSCPICQFLGKARISDPPAARITPPPLQGTLPRDIPQVVWVPVVETRGIRGPPTF